MINAQVGINTSFPQQDLHISGFGKDTSQPIIRIDGLNSQNNTAHENSLSKKRVFSDSEGNLVILNNSLTNQFYRLAPLPQTDIKGATEQPVTSKTFTLEFPSIVHMEARIGMSITNQISSNTLLKNGQARLFGSYFKLTQAPSNISTDISFGQSIISHSTNNEGAQLDGSFYIEPKKDLYLPKGDYTLVLYGYSQDPNMNFSINRISQNTQQMLISITPVSY
ncbi:hypothetical protein IQ37_19155 [Chryseobacterium piperi]|uniref:Uncharacterized protein n=1 Tax=Chryseobacterium piperi TaxID=558152 RepID=A0A086AAJ9_9FLAO|nr:hypothetical protein CJF12_15310 [Chryseobacterium piperi]KFF13713.1 hypothetical protein IQ37_19155 [Chryseobacterium piperi]